jgi:uncharacterized membrane protein
MLAFGGTHIGLATGRIRAALVAQLGERGFAALFSLIASVAFAVAVAYYAAHRNEGAPGLALGSVPVLRWILVAAVVAGIALIAAGSVAYPGSAYDMFDRLVRVPRGIERVTRHAFFAGLTLLAFAHALLATRLVGTVAFAGMGLVASLGAWHQDMKMRARRGRTFADFLAVTSAVPFAAVVAGRQRIVWRELPYGAFAIGLVVTFALRAVHGSIFEYGGVWVIASVVGGAGVFTLASWRRSVRVRTERTALRETTTAAGAHR